MTPITRTRVGDERMLFDRALEPVDGMLGLDLSRPGLGLELKRADASRYAA